MLCAPARAGALAVFAYRFNLTCAACHTVIPHINSFGQAFLKDGFRLPNAPKRAVFPIAPKVNLAYSSAVDPSGDAWLSYTSKPGLGDASAALRVTAGEFTLPLPVDPETQRDTENHYAVFDQTIGSNPFNFFDDRIGVDVAYGKSTGAGSDIHLLALEGHDPQSGLPDTGVDRMLTAQTGSTTMLISAYRYDGSRRAQSFDDRFWRQAIGVTTWRGKAELDALAQSGRDWSPGPGAKPAHSGGGFVQLRWVFAAPVFAVMRYDETHDSANGSQQSLTSSLIFRPYRNARLSLEDGVQSNRHTLNAAWLFAY